MAPTGSSVGLPLRPPSAGTDSVVGLFGSGGKSVSLGLFGVMMWPGLGPVGGFSSDLVFWDLLFFAIVGDNMKGLMGRNWML